MARHELGRLTPADAAVALRSFGRRFREVVRPDELAGDGPDPTVVPPGSSSAPVEVLARTTATLRRRQRAIEQILAEPTGRLDPADLPGGPTAPGLPAPASMATGLDDLAAALVDLAELADRTPLPRWERTAPAPTGPMRAADLLADAVAVGRSGLDDFGAALRDARAATG